jgi:hypothetical protein
MATGDQVVFCTTAAVHVPSGELMPMTLEQQGSSPHVHWRETDGVEFDTEGWYEVLLRVDWDDRDTTGTRFAHTKIPDQEPLHSEAINATVLARISQGRQLLRGNSLFGPNRTTCLRLEVWHDSTQPVEVRYAELIVRELHVPWSPDSAGGVDP